MVPPGDCALLYRAKKDCPVKTPSNPCFAFFPDCQQVAEDRASIILWTGGAVPLRDAVRDVRQDGHDGGRHPTGSLTAGPGQTRMRTGLEYGFSGGGQVCGRGAGDMPAVLHGGRPGRYRRKQQGALAGIQGLPLQGGRVRHDEGAGAYKGQEGDVRQRRQDADTVRDLLLPLLETGKGGRMQHQQDGTLLPGVRACNPSSRERMPSGLRRSAGRER